MHEKYCNECLFSFCFINVLNKKYAVSFSSGFTGNFPYPTNVVTLHLYLLKGSGAVLVNFLSDKFSPTLDLSLLFILILSSIKACQCLALGMFVIPCFYSCLRNRCS